ncbi:MAG: hypothetical protein IT258_06795 [Saprospiraceae bacterium]|nr:hypothetical protein [Saprospiraceae bacterium]
MVRNYLLMLFLCFSAIAMAQDNDISSSPEIGVKNPKKKTEKPVNKPGFMEIKTFQTGSRTSYSSTGGWKTRNFYDTKFRIDDAPYRSIGKKGVNLEKHFKGNQQAMLHLQKFRSQKRTAVITRIVSSVGGLSLIVAGAANKGWVSPMALSGFGVFFGGGYGSVLIGKSSYQNLERSVEYYNKGL